MRIIQAMGFRYWKDTFGFYFEKDVYRFSVIQIGPFYDISYNKKIQLNFQLQDKVTGKISLLEGLQWILNIIRKDINNGTINHSGYLQPS